MGTQLNKLQPEERIKYYQRAYEIMMDPNYDPKASKYAVLDLSVSRNKLYGWANHYILNYATSEEEEKYYTAIAARQTNKAVGRLENIKTKQKAAFDIFITGENIIEQFEKLAKKYNVAVKTIHKYKRDYLVYATEEEKIKYGQVSKMVELRQHYPTYSTENVDADIFEKVLGFNSPEEIKVFLDSNGLDHDFLNGLIRQHKSKFPNNIADFEQLKVVKARYIKYLLKQRNERIKQIKDQIKKDNILAAQTFISKFVNSTSTNFEDFCTSKKIDIAKADLYLNITKEHNPAIYSAYTEKDNVINEGKRELAREKIDQIIPNLKKKYTAVSSENHKKYKEFNILDYYLITQSSFTETVSDLEKYGNAPELALFREFIHQYDDNLSYLNEEKICSLYYAYHFVEVTTQTKKEVINFLKDNNIPTYEIVYNYAIKYHLDGKLVIGNQETNVKQKKLAM